MKLSKATSALNGFCIILTLLITFVMILFCTVASAADPPVSQAQILSWMQELQPLQKVHYSWPIKIYNLSDDLLYEYVRLTHAYSFNGVEYTSEQIDRVVQLCKKVNDTNPTIPVSIGVNYSPWHYKFGKDLPPTDFGATHDAELSFMKTNFERFRTQLMISNTKYGTNISVTAILLDSERFKITPNDDNWNAAMTEKHNAVYKIAQEVFPMARIEWYEHGAVRPWAYSTSSDGTKHPRVWRVSQYFTLDEKGNSYGVSLYRVSELAELRESIRRTFENAQTHGIAEVTPWIALASGYRFQVDTPLLQWSLDWNYDLIYSWQLGAEINIPSYGNLVENEHFAPWNAAKIAVFFPDPFNKKVPYWGEHFVAYVRGANGIKQPLEA
ncbi:hypothetical protein ACFL50_00595, partial [Candidatus Latescibacterota bacterium]